MSTSIASPVVAAAQSLRSLLAQVKAVGGLPLQSAGMLGAAWHQGLLALQLRGQLLRLSRIAARVSRWPVDQPLDASFEMSDQLQSLKHDYTELREMLLAHRTALRALLPSLGQVALDRMLSRCITYASRGHNQCMALWWDVNHHDSGLLPAHANASQWIARTPEEVEAVLDRLMNQSQAAH